MIFNRWLKPKSRDALSPDLVALIEEAVLLGNVAELDVALARLQDERDVPEDVRYGLEALRHFRAWYGPGRDLEPVEPLQKQKATVMEIAWGAEILDKIRHTHKIVALRA